MKTTNCLVRSSFLNNILSTRVERGPSMPINGCPLRMLSVRPTDGRSCDLGKRTNCLDPVLMLTFPREFQYFEVRDDLFATCRFLALVPLY